MATTTNKQYPIFEADQVLSDKHLNGLVSYLEKEERDTRTYLLGVGVACGLELSIAPNNKAITISEGTAVTTEGYLIKFAGATYSYYKDAEIAEDFKSYIDGQIYKDAYINLSNAHELQENTTEESLGEFSNDFLEEKVVILLVEAQLIDQKNCTTTSCDDKGLRLEFNIKPIIVNQSWITTYFPTSQLVTPHFDKLFLQRFNVQKTTLVTGTHIFTAFQKAIDSSISETSNNIALLFNHYKEAFDVNNEFTLLNNISSKLNSVISDYKNSPNLQYVYDWISDIHCAYNELVDFCKVSPGICCISPDAFPYHISLGVAYDDTIVIRQNKAKNHLLTYRNDAIKTGFLSKEAKDKQQVFQDLLKRLFLIVDSFEIDTSLSIKITPSSYGKVKLGEKAIPFYYKNLVIEALSSVWHPLRTCTFRTDEILSYHSKEYSEIEAVNNPLPYDIEPYNFYTIEGHIGKEYTRAITEIKSIQDSNRLPFQVVGINAVDETGRTIAFNNQGGGWDDLEVEYDLAKTKLINTSNFIYKWLMDNKKAVQNAISSLDDEFYTTLKEAIDEFQKLLTPDLPEFLVNYEAFYEAFEELNDLFLMYNNLIDFFQSCKLEGPILEEIENRFDEFNVIVLEDSFKVIYEEAARRWRDAIKKTMLKNYANSNTAIQHKLGVEKGGTFVMVYTDYSVFEQNKIKIPIKGFFNASKLLISKLGFSETKIKNIKATNLIRKRRETTQFIQLNTKTDNPCEENKTEAVEQMRKTIEVGMAKKFNPEVTAYFLNEIKPLYEFRPNQQPITDITPKNTIIADFYLPYICCGDGDAVNIVINTPEKPTEPIIADFKYPDFNEKDFETDKPQV